MTGWSLDLTTVDENEGASEKKSFAPLPKGDYKVVITECTVEDEKVSKKGAKYRSAKLVLQVIDGEHANRLVWYNVMLEHETSDLAQRIGRVLLKKLSQAVGTDADIVPGANPQLYNKPIIAVIDVEEGRAYKDANGIDQKYPDRNRVLDAKPLSGSSAPAPKAEKKSGASWLEA